MKTLLTPAAILQRLYDLYGVTSDIALAGALNVPRQSINLAKKRGHIPEEWLVRTCLNTGVTMDSLLFEKEDLDSTADGFIFIPCVSATLSAGGGSFQTDGNVISRYSFRKDWIRNKGNPKDLVLMNVYGDSMEPTLYDGDLVMVNKSLTSPQPYMMYAMRVDDALYVKQLEVHPGKFILKSLNQKYGDIEVPRSEAFENCFQILGKIVWHCHDIR